ncbi:centrosomal protein of 72 kDa isoform X2 [Myotis lucifugus]|uniref:centrosomal protein of 72 kDa isoform X2 n=1 Tax=Myotis lucifugus TaxID=59463 RepID=UPI000CCC8216|nr:centrosomal protein of 72 kDa isoform X2 [Myotis lucifugus]
MGGSPGGCACVNLAVYFFSCGSRLPPKQCLRSELCGSRAALLQSAPSIPEKPRVATRAQHPFTGSTRGLWGTLWRGQPQGDRRPGTSGGSLVTCGALQGGMGCRKVHLLHGGACWFLWHLSPDDRPVRESERKASQLHFASEESLDSTQSLPAVCRGGRLHHSRVKCPDPSAKKCLVMDADDEAVLNLIAECEWDLSNPPRSTSSSQKEQEDDFHSSQESRHLLSPHLVQHQCGDSIKKGHEKRKGSSRGCCPEKRLQNQYCGELPPQQGDQPEACCSFGHHVHFLPHPDCIDVENSTSTSQTTSLSTQKVLNPLPGLEKYRKRRMPGGRFQAPADQECLSCLEESLNRQNGSESRSERTCSHLEASESEEQRPHSTSGAREVSPKLLSAVPPGKAILGVALLESLLDLVDRYWSGCKSLHSNEVFLAQARHVLSSVQDFTATQDSSTTTSEEINYLTLENKSLQNHLVEQQQQYSEKMSEVVSELNNTRKEMDDLRQHLDRSLEENSSLKSLLCSMKREVKNADASAALNLQITGLQTNVKRLSGEIVELKQHLEHYDKVQELTQMLQESHSSLVSTNEHLLQELGQVRAQHRAEVEQLHWSYKELKKTMALFPVSSTRLSGCS